MASQGVSTTSSLAPPTPTSASHTPSTWVIVGASRGIGLEFTRQLLARGDQVIAAVRHPETANLLWQLVGAQTRPGSCVIETCDITREEDIAAFTARMRRLVEKGMRIDNIVLNAGILKYPGRATEISFNDFALHLHTNTIGPIICAQQLLPIITSSTSQQSPAKVIFISSDSGSTALFRAHEDGFGAYAASKAALNQMLRHFAAELKRKQDAGDKTAVGQVGRKVCVLAMHPGEVSTDMADVELGWEVEGIIGAEESITGMLRVVDDKGKDTANSGTFWTWDGREHPW